MASISSKDMTLLLLGMSVSGPTKEGIGGITRLQKLLFLLVKEENIKPAGDRFEFTAFKAGPYSARLYDDLEFLENLGLIESEVVSETTDAEATEVDQLNFDDLMNEDERFTGESPRAADAYEERRYWLTDKGLEHVKAMLKKCELQPVTDSIRKIKSRFGHHSLSDLLYYVYTKYPEMTVESEIRDRVLRRRK
jgi:uncharacterized protein YwgA